MKYPSWLVVAVGIVSLTGLLLSGCGIFKPRDFSSLAELEEWLENNDVSEEPITVYADEWYRKALRIQEDALEDGYIISADYDLMEDGESATVWCVAIVRGRVFFWDPETDDVTEEIFFGTVK